MPVTLRCPECKNEIGVTSKAVVAWCRCGANSRKGRPLMIAVDPTEDDDS